MIQDEEIKLPCLLDRLLDANPTVTQESRDQRRISFKDYKAAVLRDLSWLLNSSRQRDSELIYDYPEGRNSVLNYGIRDLTGMTQVNLGDIDVEKEIRDAILAFEPRILPDSLQVRLVYDHEMENGRVAFEISGLLWALPYPERLRVRTEVDLETGACQFPNE